MPSSKDKDVEADDRSREKRHRSSKTTDRKERDGEKEKHREKDKERDRDKDKAKDRDRDRDRDRERRHRDRDNDRDNLERDKDSSTSHRHRSSRSSKVGPTDSETHSRSHRHRRVREMDKDEGSQTNSVAGSSMTDLVPELRRGLESERGSLPYPSFSKAHSKESLLSRVDVTAAPRRTDPLTPEATDLGGSEIKRSKSVDSPPISRKVSSRKESRKEDRPPSPPETDLSSQKNRSGTPVSVREEELRQEERPHSRESSRVSRSASTASQYESKSKVSRASSQRTFILQQHIPTRMERSRAATAASEVTEASTVDSGATSVTQRHHSVRSVSTARPSPTEADSSPESAADSSPKTPMTTHQFPPPSILPEDKSYSHYVINPSDVSTPVATPAPMAPPPPPPPPPLFNMQDVPRVDYLMQNGGLPTPVPRQFLAVLPKQNGTRPSIPPLQGPETLFAPFFNLLNQYQSVLSGNGSVAVATGHRTVARRLLDRLENVFSRDLSSGGCSCVMCDSLGQPRRGLGWGEVLERVSGRVDLPQWPPFDLALIGSKAAEDLADIPVRPASPIKMDPDIAEEFREHYLRQTKRVRVAVDKWMSNCDKAPAPPPQEVDDETLTFAILTNLESSDRPFFNALLSGSRDLHPATRAPTPLRRPRNDFVVKMGLSLQRLYRLHTSPRDAETAVYLVKNPALHDLLHTISEINPSEWEILTSGRFDGFLWSGAEDDGRMQSPDKGLHLSPGASSGIFPHRDVASPGLRSAASPRNRPFSPFSRGPTPGTGIYSRGPTPASFISGVSVASSSYPSRAAVSHDEETEIAVLAELEREIFNGMEALEDAFEKLHDRAMTVRDGLRRRGAALSMGLQQRRGANGVSVLPLSGSSGVYDVPVWADDESTDGEGRPDIASDWGDDQMSELAPDDSASQISSNRHRRQTKRRKERATPAPIEEEEEG